VKTKRILIIGGPGTGKTTFANELARKTGFELVHTDDLMHMNWSDQSEVLARKMAHTAAEDGAFIVEGVAAVRALRKALDMAQKPVDEIHIMRKQHLPGYSKGADAMRKGIDTVWRGIEEKVLALGISVVVHN
jgi:2-phosphoglycerate kinase